MAINLTTLQNRIDAATNQYELSSCIFTGTKTLNIHQVLLDNQNEITSILARDTALGGNILPANRGLLQLARIPGILPADLMTIINHPNTNAAVLDVVVANAASDAASDTAVLESRVVAGLSTVSLTSLATRTLTLVELTQIANHANADANVLTAIANNAATDDVLLHTIVVLIQARVINDAVLNAAVLARDAVLKALTPAELAIVNPVAPPVVPVAPPVAPVAPVAPVVLPVIDQVANAAEAFFSPATQAKIAAGVAAVALIPADRWNALEEEYLQPIADANPLGLPAVIDPALELGQQLAEAAKKFEVMVEATETIQQARAGQTVTVASPEKAKEIVAQGGLVDVAKTISPNDAIAGEILAKTAPETFVNHYVRRFIN